MIITRPFKISGVGWYLPHTQVASSEIEEKLNLPAGWIVNHTGVETRHIALTESNTDMGHLALKQALSDAGLELTDLDCLIAAAATFDYIIPNRSTLLKASFENAMDLHFPCMDINTVCTSFISAVDVASHLLQSGAYKHIAIVTSEKGSLGLNTSDPETYSLFGDAAAAVILSHDERGEGGLIKFRQRTYSEGVMDTMIPGGGNVFHPRNHPYDEQQFSFQMKGSRLLRIAQQHVPGFLAEMFCSLPGGIGSMDWIVPHQASKLGLRMLTHYNGGRVDNIVNQLAMYGNCIAASIPLGLVTTIKNGKIKEGDNCFMVGTAAGMSIAGLVFKYSRS